MNSLLATPSFKASVSFGQDRTRHKVTNTLAAGCTDSLERNFIRQATVTGVTIHLQAAIWTSWVASAA